MERIKCIYILIATTIILTVSHDIVVVQEGSTYSSVYVRDINFKCDTFAWSRKNQSMISCYKYTSAPSGPFLYRCDQQPFITKVESQLNIEKDVLTTNLTILNVSRKKDEYEYEYDGPWNLNCTDTNSILLTFDMKIYSKPKSLECTNDVSRNGLTISCKSERIYPEANFVANYNENQIFQGSCQNTYDFDSLYYNSSCNYTISAANMKIGTLILNMTVYPDVTFSINDTAFGESRLLTFNSENPIVTLTDCPTKDVIENMNLNCTCRRLDFSEIPTRIFWQINGTQMMNSTENVLVLTSMALRYNTNFTCLAVNAFNWSSGHFQFIPSILYPAVVKSLSVNETLRRETILEKGSPLKIRCEAVGNPEPTLNLMSNNKQLVGPSKNNYTLIMEKNVDCMDSGIYACSAINTLGNSQQNSTVLIKCPQQLQDPSDNERIFKSIFGGNFSIKVSVFGYPIPFSYKLIRSDVNVLTINESNSQIDASHKYEIKYNEDYLTYGNVSLTIFNMTLEDFDTYTLEIFNGEKGNLTFLFNIENDENKIPYTDGVDDINWPAIVGGLAAALIAIIIIVTIVAKKILLKTDEEMVDIINDDVYWIDFTGTDMQKHPYTVPVKKYSGDYISSISSASAHPGNYVSYSSRK